MRLSKIHENLQKVSTFPPVTIIKGWKLSQSSQTRNLTTNFPQLATVLQNPQEELDHTKALQHIHAKTKTKLLEQSDQHNKVRLTAYSATGADAWLKAIPSLNQDTLMSNVAFRITLSMRLGIAIFETGLGYSFCQ